MEIKSLATVAMIEYVICYCCSSGTLIPGYGLQYGRVINSHPSRTERGAWSKCSNFRT
jgi:hypothetical protein